MKTYSIEKLTFIIAQMIISGTIEMQMPDGSIMSIPEINQLINQMRANKKTNYVVFSN